MSFHESSLTQNQVSKMYFIISFQTFSGILQLCKRIVSVWKHSGYKKLCISFCRGSFVILFNNFIYFVKHFWLVSCSSNCNIYWLRSTLLNFCKMTEGMLSLVSVATFYRNYVDRVEQAVKNISTWLGKNRFKKFPCHE